MQPRLPTSVKWTPFPKEFLEKVETVFKKTFEGEADTGEFLIDGRIYPQEILMRVGYLEEGRLRQANFESSVDYKADDTTNNAMERIYACVDATAEMMEEHFQAEAMEETIELPTRWTEYETENGTVYLQFSTVNTRLEDEANRLLGLTEDQLVLEHPADEDALSNSVVDTELAFALRDRLRKMSQTH